MTQSTNRSVPVLTVDGPSGAGKGTICRLLARQTGFALLDSGALYRLTALAAMDQGVNVLDVQGVAKVARELDVDFDPAADATSVTLAGRDVTAAIRQEEVGMNASVVAAYPPVREALLDRQRQFAREPGLVADGRDMGTVVFPNALLKIYLTASAEERAKRRLLQLEAAGIDADRDQLVKDIMERDLRDSTRAVAPLKPADDAVVLDSTEMSVAEVRQQILDLLHSVFKAH